MLSKRIKANAETIKLEQDKQLFYKAIYNLKPKEFEIFKTYIENNLPTASTIRLHQQCTSQLYLSKSVIVVFINISNIEDLIIL